MRVSNGDNVTKFSFYLTLIGQVLLFNKSCKLDKETETWIIDKLNLKVSLKHTRTSIVTKMYRHVSYGRMQPLEAILH